MPVLPSSLALTSIADGSNIVAADHRNNYSALQTAFNALLADLALGTAGDVLGGVGTTISFAKPPGYELAYAEYTTSVSITATTEGTAQQVVSAGALTFDGSTPVYLDFWCPFLLIGAGTPTVEFFDGATSLGGVQTIGATVLGFNMRRRVTPSAAAHTYTVKAFTSAGTATAGAGAGGSLAGLPGFIRVVKA